MTLQIKSLDSIAYSTPHNSLSLFLPQNYFQLGSMMSYHDVIISPPFFDKGLKGAHKRMIFVVSGKGDKSGLLKQDKKLSGTSSKPCIYINIKIYPDKSTCMFLLRINVNMITNSCNVLREILLQCRHNFLQTQH